MPAAAQRAFEAANQRQATGRINNRTHPPQNNHPKQATQRDYRLTKDYRDYLADERDYCNSRNTSRRAEIRALQARTYLHTQRKPRLTARRLDIAKVQDAADKARAARARSPERRRAAMYRHMNTANYSILKERGLRK